YQLVSIGPEFETPAGKEPMHPVMKLMEDYALKLRTEDYLAKYVNAKHPVQIKQPNARFVGSDRCENCHKHAYNIWKHTDHARAYQTLVDAKHPSTRQFDGDCVVCHVVGFGYHTGFNDGMLGAQAKLKLRNVGCESCHGPCGDHVKNPQNQALYADINPWKARKPKETKAEFDRRMLEIDTMCQKCHDTDNDVKWDFSKWTKRGLNGAPPIIQMNPPQQPPNPQLKAQPKKN